MKDFLSFNFIFTLTILTLSIVLLTGGCGGIVQSAQIDQVEFNSFEWLVLLYRQNFNLSLDPCTSFPFNVICVNDSNGNQHFSELYITGGNAAGLAPDPSLTDLHFPNLTIFFVNNRPMYPNINILPKFMNICKSLQRLSIENDPNIDSIPPNFIQSFPLMTEFTLKNVSLPTLPLELFMNNLTNMNVENQFTQSILFDPAVTYSTTLKSLQIAYGQGDLQFNISPNNFPNLVACHLFAPSKSVITRINTDISSNSLRTFTFKQSNILLNESQFNFTLNVPSIEKIDLYDYDFQPGNRIKYILIKPELWVNLTMFTVTGQIDTDTPVSVTNKTNYAIQSSNLQTFPSGTAKSWAQVLLVNNNLTGTIPLGFIGNSSNVGVVISGNPNLVGAVPEDFCRAGSFDVSNTGITSVPDCAYCYKNIATTILKFDVPIPLDFICAPQFYSASVISADGRITLRGKNLGYAIQGDSTSGLTIVVPNEVFILNVPQPPSTQRSVLVNFSTTLGISYNVTYDFAMLNFNNVGVAQYPGGLLATLNMNYFNPDIPMTITMNGKPCVTQSSTPPTSITCFTAGIPENIITTYAIVSIENAYTKNTRSTFYYILYPVSTSVSNLDQRGGNVTFTGDFGTYLNKPSVSIDGQVCPILEISQTTLVCEYLPQQPGTLLPTGPRTVIIIVDGYTFTSPTLLTVDVFDVVDYCMKTFNNCSGHGQCNDLGACVCTGNYTGDRCDLVPGGGVFVPNTTSPTSSFQIDGYQFNFSMVSIQELDIEDNIVYELLTDNWIYTNTTNHTVSPGLESHSYHLNVSFLPYVDARIEFSNQSRVVEFGGVNQTYLPNTIKMAVNITYWQYTSSLNHLRVVYRTVLSTNIIEDNGCGDSGNQTTEESIVKGLDANNIQYLKVYRNENVFFGTFLDYVVSDGRKTFSRTELINQTEIETDGGNQTSSDTFIGVILPRCLVCMMDPSFNSLIQPNYYDRAGNDECSSDDDDRRWKIIVGCVVGGFALVAITVASVLYYKRLKKARFQDRQMQNKLKRLSQQS